jgi:hypothetical protein
MGGAGLYCGRREVGSMRREGRSWIALWEEGSRFNEKGRESWIVLWEEGSRFNEKGRESWIVLWEEGVGSMIREGRNWIVLWEEGSRFYGKGREELDRIVGGGTQVL